MSSWLDEVPWNGDGLIAVVVQDAESGRVLTVAWMNREALAQTAATREAVYWSRSRRRLWRKGEESGHVQKVRELRLDCDADAVLLQVEQVGGIACHTGRRSDLQCPAIRIRDDLFRRTRELLRSSTKEAARGSGAFGHRSRKGVRRRNTSEYRLFVIGTRRHGFRVRTHPLT